MELQHTRFRGLPGYGVGGIRVLESWIWVMGHDLRLGYQIEVKAQDQSYKVTGQGLGVRVKGQEKILRV